MSAPFIKVRQRARGIKVSKDVAASEDPSTQTDSFAGFKSDELYNTPQLEDRTGQKVAFWEARRAKELPPKYLKLGRNVKYLGADIIAYLRDSYQGGGGDSD
ncbi:MAG: hypothetical protein EPO08_16505 [Rhodospirillaceae bacterium]|nr:MAG: hypothetical protein EPO08_16505 [Rhodospirillaceae bacterium]